MGEKKKLKERMFWSMVLTIGITYFLIILGIPAISRWVTDLALPLPVPGTLVLIYMALVLVASFIYVTFDDRKLDEFLRPITTLLKGGYGGRTRLIVLVVLPILAGWRIYDFTAPKISSPTALRVQHPLIQFPQGHGDIEEPNSESNG